MNNQRWKLDPYILLCPNIPMPLHGIAPRVVMGNGWWDRVRQTAYKSTNYRCKSCGVHKTKAKFHKHLEAHELYHTDYEKGKMTYLEAVPLCHGCHAYIHDGRLAAMLSKGELSHTRFVAIIQHGDRILRGAGLKRLSKANRDNQLISMIQSNKCASWSKWRLIISHREFGPKFKDPMEYAAHWNCDYPNPW